MCVCARVYDTLFCCVRKRCHQCVESSNGGKPKFVLRYCDLYAFHFVLKSFENKIIELSNNIYHLDVSGQPGSLLCRWKWKLLVFFGKKTHKHEIVFIGCHKMQNVESFVAAKWTKICIHIQIWSIVLIARKKRVPKRLKKYKNSMFSSRCQHEKKVINFLENEDIVCNILWPLHLRISLMFGIVFFSSFRNQPHEKMVLRK